MPKTFKVISQVIRLRRHGGVYTGRNNVEYPIRDAAQFALLKKLEATGDVQIMCTPEERKEYDAAAPQEPKVEAPKPAEKPAETPAPTPAPEQTAPAAPEASGDDKKEDFDGDGEDLGGDI